MGFNNPNHPNLFCISNGEYNTWHLMRLGNALSASRLKAHLGHTTTSPYMGHIADI